MHPDITVWGEHAGFLAGLVDSRNAVCDERLASKLDQGFTFREMVVGELSDREVFQPWVSPFRAVDIEDEIRALIVSLFTRGVPETVRWGFKEVRYDENQLRVLMELFPQAHLVILARDIAGYTSSRFFAFGNTDFDLESEEGRAAAATRVTEFSDRWVRRYRGLLSLAEHFQGRISTVAYSDLVSGSSRPQQLFAELGESPAPNDAIEAVLAAVAGSSYKHNSAARSNREKLAELIDDVNIDRDELDELSLALGVETLPSRH